MMRVTIEILPGGSEERARTIGLIEIANVGGDASRGDYAVVLKKTPPFAGALKAAWRRGIMGHDDIKVTGVVEGDFDDVMTGSVVGHHRTRRGCYDLLYRALVACGMEKR